MPINERTGGAFGSSFEVKPSAGIGVENPLYISGRISVVYFTARQTSPSKTGSVKVVPSLG